MKFLDQFLDLRLTDFIRKIYHVINIRFFQKFNINILRTLIYFKTPTLKLGSNIKIFGLCHNVTVGFNCEFYDNSIFEFSENAKFSVGNYCVLSYGVVVSCRKSISIGNFVQIGEYTSIRDNTHDYSNQGKPMKFNKDISDDITIGNDVWIGKNCIILPGTKVGNGVVIGANSVVKGNLESNNIYGGNPLKKLKSR